MISRRPLDKNRDRRRKSASKLGAVRISAADGGRQEGARLLSAVEPAEAPQETDQPVQSPATSQEPYKSKDAGLHSTPPGTPWNVVHDVFRKLADADFKGTVDLALLKPSILDKGIGAIGAVGMAAVHAANTLDHAVEHLFENWHAPVASLPSCDTSTEQSPRNHARSGAESLLPAAEASQQPQHAQQPSRKNVRLKGDGKEDHAQHRRSARIADAGSDGCFTGQRVKELQEELQRLHSTQTEYLQLRDQLDKLQAELMYTSNKCNALSQENNLLRKNSTGSQSQAKTKTDPLAEQVAAQLQALLQEKAKLAIENARLVHENTSLQELLEYTHSSVICDEDISYLEEEEGWCSSPECLQPQIESSGNSSSLDAA